METTGVNVLQQADRVDAQRKKLAFVTDAIAARSEFELTQHGTYGLFLVLREVCDALQDIEHTLRQRNQTAQVA